MCKGHYYERRIYPHPPQFSGNIEVIFLVQHLYVLYADNMKYSNTDVFRAIPMFPQAQSTAIIIIAIS